MSIKIKKIAFGVCVLTVFLAFASSSFASDKSKPKTKFSDSTLFQDLSDFLDKMKAFEINFPEVKFETTPDTFNGKTEYNFTPKNKRN